MSEDLELETYLSISPNKFGIYLLDPKKIKICIKRNLDLKITLKI